MLDSLVCLTQPDIYNSSLSQTSTAFTTAGAQRKRSLRLFCSWLTIVLRCRGELPDDMSASYERQRKAYEALQRAVASLADTMEKSMPDLPEPSSVTRTKDGGIVVLTGRVSFSSLQLSLQLDSRFAYLFCNSGDHTLDFVSDLATGTYINSMLMPLLMCGSQACERSGNNSLNVLTGS